MKKILFGLVSLFLASQLFVSCSSENNMMSQFSKRKYLKKFKDKNIKHKDDIDQLDNNIAYTANADEYVSTEIEPTNFQLEEIEVADNSTMIELGEEKTVQLKLVKNASKDYSEWNRYNRNMNFSNMENKVFSKNIDLNKSSVVSNNQVNEVVLVILAIFIPPLAVYLYEDSITNNFWIDLILTLLFWLPGMIYAFLVIFAGVSV